MIDVFPRSARVFCRAFCRLFYRVRTAVLVVTLLTLVAGNAVAARLLILPSQDQPVYQQLIVTLTTQLADTPWTSQVLGAGAPLAPDVLDPADLLITLGTQAAQRALALPDPPPTLAVFIPRRTFDTLVEENPAAARRRAEGRLGALYLEQPFSRQLDLVALVAPRARILGTLLGPASLQEQTAIETAASRHGLQLLAATLGEDDNPIERLDPVIGHSGVLLAVPDKAIFNRRTARWMLMMTLRQRIPLIAYSRLYVEAGAVAAVYSTTDTVGREAAVLASQWLMQGVLPGPDYPQLFEVSTNPATARSLGLDLPDADTLEEALRSLRSP